MTEKWNCNEGARMIKTELANRLQESGLFREVKVTENGILCTCEPEKIRDVARLMQSLGLRTVLTVEVVDFPRTRKFVLLYTFTSLEDPKLSTVLVHVKTAVPRDRPEIDSIADIFPAADYFERECYEMFGVVFRGNEECKGTFFLDKSLERAFPQRKRP